MKKSYQTHLLQFALLVSFTSEAVANEFQVLSDQSGNAVSLMNSPFVQRTIGEYNNDLSCSHTWVSNDGLLLTAFHCIVGCLEKGEEEVDGAYRPIAARKIPGYPARVYTLDTTRLGEVRCSISGLRDSAPPYQKRPSGLRAKILATGARSWIPVDSQHYLEKKYPDVLAQLRKQGFVGVGDEGDFALLKIEQVPGVPLATPGHPYFAPSGQCIPIDDVPAAPGQRVWNLSYPDLSSRPNGKDLVYKPLVSGGRVYTKENHPLFPKESLSEISDAFYYSSNDVEVGSSGSSLLNSQGKVAGVVAMSISERDKYTKGSTLFIPSSFILQKFREQLGDDFVRSNLLNGCTVSSNTRHLLSLIQQVPTED